MVAGPDIRSAQGLIALQRLPRIGRATALRAALRGSPFGDVGPEPRQQDLLDAYEWAGAELGRHRSAGVDVLTFFDREFPPNLTQIADPPVLLFVRGNVDLLADPRMVAVVGTREPSKFGVDATRGIVSELARSSWGIVSGLARGIDTIAHRAALDNGAPTLAILGCGLDRIYPRENEELANEIVESGGALVSELPFGAPPIPRNLIARDRLQSGASVAVVVAQSAAKGGAMHTALFAAEQGRPLFCPEPPDASGKNEGLWVLLDRPSDHLCEILPAWRQAGALCARLGPRPLARAVSPGALQDFFDRLEMALDRSDTAEQQSLLFPDLIG